jgi:lipopolysaccharide heptosyltransferase I
VIRLLVVRLGSLGDLVHALPAVAALRRAFPATDIDWLVDDVHREFLELVPVVTRIVSLGGRTPGAWLEARRLLRVRSYDAAVDFQGLLKSAVLARLSGARRVLGFDRGGLREPAAAIFYSERLDVGEGQHVIDKNLALAAFLGAPTTVREFPLREVESRVVAEVRSRIDGPFALINGGAAWPNKRWPADRFARLAVWMRERFGLSSVVLWGPGEVGLADEIARASEGAAIVAPPTPLSDLVAFARRAAIMISGDTGPTHIAAAVGTPIVALFGPTDPARNGPWAIADEVVSRYASCECHYERRCRRDVSGWCLGSIGEDDVRAAVERRLSR